MAERVLVAGATGRLGTEVIRECRRRGYRVRAMGRNDLRLAPLAGEAHELAVADAMDHRSLRPLLQGVDCVFSCLGASVIPMPRYGRVTFSKLDFPANRNLIEAAVKAGVGKFVYVSVFGHRKLPQMDFIRGHELVVEELRASGMDYAVLRPTGFFSAMDEILLVASRGLLPEFNGGTARTNPIHERDLAELCVDAFGWQPGEERDVGGPDALTRHEIAALAWKAIGKEARAVKVPVAVLRAAGKAFLPFNPRVGNLFTFIAEILIEDFVAPLCGTRHISDYFAERAGEMRGAR